MGGDYDDQNALGREVEQFFGAAPEDIQAVVERKRVVLRDGTSTVAVDGDEFAKAFQHAFDGKYKDWDGRVSGFAVQRIASSAEVLGYTKTAQSLKRFGDTLRGLPLVLTETGKMWSPPSTSKQDLSRPGEFTRAADLADIQADVLCFFEGDPK
jgi:hypothetical protein